MTNVSAVATWLLPIPGEPHKMRFLASYIALNFNTDNITLLLPQSFRLSGKAKAIIIERVSLRVVNNGPNAMVFGAPRVMNAVRGTTDFAYIDPWTTPVATNCCHIWELFIPSSTDISSTWVVFDEIATYTALDDIYATVWGVIEWEESETKIDEVHTAPVAVPVTLEGYKWPLARRP